MMKFKKSNQTQWEKKCFFQVVSRSFLPKNSGRKSLEPSLWGVLSSTCEAFPQLNPPLGLEKFQLRNVGLGKSRAETFRTSHGCASKMRILRDSCAHDTILGLVSICNFPLALFFADMCKRYTFPTRKIWQMRKDGACGSKTAHH